MTPEMIALAIYAIETTTRLIKESKMTEDQIREAAIKEVLKFVRTMQQINDEIAKYT